MRTFLDGCEVQDAAAGVESEDQVGNDARGRHHRSDHSIEATRDLVRILRRSRTHHDARENPWADSVFN